AHGRWRCCGVVGRHLDLVESIGSAGHSDVALDVWLFQRLLRRAYLELLDNPGVHAASEDGGDDQHGGTDPGYPPATDHGRNNKQDGYETGRYSEYRLGRDDREDVGVEGT